MLDAKRVDKNFKEEPLINRLLLDKFLLCFFKCVEGEKLAVDFFVPAQAKDNISIEIIIERKLSRKNNITETILLSIKQNTYQKKTLPKHPATLDLSYKNIDLSMGKPIVKVIFHYDKY